MQFRTDLALEAAINCADGLPDDALREEKRVGEITVDRLTLGERSADAIGRKQGRYVTVSFPPLTDNDRHLEEAALVIGDELASLLPRDGTVLVVGLGNESITPDALGPHAADMVLATRHIRGEFARSSGLDDLRPVAVMRTGVLGDTGLESGETVAALCREIRPAAVVAIDALACRSLTRLGCTVQLCNSGIAPGSGVGNARAPLCADTLGVPVVGIGVPTVVDAVTVAQDLTGTDGGERVTPNGRAMMVTPREVDLMIARASRLVALGINAALQPHYSPADLVSAAV